MAKTFNRLNSTFEGVSGKCSRSYFFASHANSKRVSTLSIASTSTIVSFIGRRDVSIVIGYTNCASIGETRSRGRRTSLLGTIIPKVLTTTTGRASTLLVRFSASCICSKRSGAPCQRGSPTNPLGYCKRAGLSNSVAVTTSKYECVVFEVS